MSVASLASVRQGCKIISRDKHFSLYRIINEGLTFKG
jgi:hypothetical protein